MITLKTLRRQQYLYHIGHDRSFYTWFKARFYMEGAARSVYWLRNTNIHPSVLTLLYGLLGIIGGVLLCIPNKLCVSLALCIFFTKGILDWADGHLARLKGKTSDIGRKLDILCGIIGTVSFYLGVGVFFGHVYGYFMIPWVLMLVYVYKRLGYQVSRAYFVDSIILLVGLINIYLT